MRFALVVGVALLAGCAGSFEIELGDGFTQDESVLVQRAVGAWEAAGADRSGHWRIRHAKLRPGIEGEADEAAHEIRISPSAPDFYHTVLHELGHAHGVAHIDERDHGVMCPNEELPTCADEIASADIAQCRVDGACR